MSSYTADPGTAGSITLLLQVKDLVDGHVYVLQTV